MASSKTQAANFVDEPALLGQCQEMLRGDQAEGRMGPAQKRFHGHHLAGAEVDLRLVVQREGTLFHGLTQVLNQGEAIGFVVERSLVDVEGPPFGLGPVHGDVRTADQIAGGQRVVRGQRDADAGADVQAGRADVDRLFQQRRDALCHRRRLVGIRSIEQHRELVAAQACHQILATDDLADARTDLAQQLVPGLVPEGVVDLLEVVQIDQQQGQPPGLGGVGRERCQCQLELFQEVATISEPGELVGLGLMLTRLVERPLLVQREGHAGGSRQKRRPGEGEGDGADMPHVAQDKDQEARRQDEGEDDRPWSLLHQRRTPDRPWPQPHRGGEGDQCCRPQQVEPRAEPAGTRRQLMEGDDVPDRKQTASGCEQHGARRLPRHHHDHRTRERQQDEVADRSGQVHRHRNAGAVDRTQDGGKGQRGADGRDAQAGDDAVERDGRTDPSRFGAQEEDQCDARQRI